jgi:arginine:ornithine antiporter/lysine permease
VFADNLTGSGDIGPLFDQVRGTMLVTVFVFLGVEGASVYSRHARRREDVGRATVLGFLSVFAIFASVTIVSYGVLPYAEIAQLRQPSMGGVLEAAYGTWGNVFVSIGLIVSVLGAYLAWTLMAAEVLYVAAQDRDMPRFLAGVRRGDVPFASLLLTTILIQIVLVVTYFSEDAFNFALDLTSALSLIPFLFAAGYAVKIGRGRDLLVAGLATAYTVFLLFAAGPKFLLISFIIYAPATVLFVMARREQGRRLFSPREYAVLAVSVAGAVAGVVALAAGWISI